MLGTEQDHIELFESIKAGERREGHAVGVLEGLTEGYDKATTEHVINMHKEGLSYDLIARIVGLTKQEVINIIENNN